LAVFFADRDYNLGDNASQQLLAFSDSGHAKLPVDGH
jgi:hypothetical protein